MAGNLQQGAIKALASLGVGLLPGAPGSYGSALAAASAALWLAAGGRLWGWIYGGALLAMGVLGLWVCRRALALKVFGADQDPPQVVIDEAAGMLLALAGCGLDWRLPAAFIAFRFFDLIKPLGVNRLQGLPGAWGIMADDVLAGVYAWLAVRGLQFLFGA